MADNQDKLFSDDEFLAVPIASLISRKDSISDIYIRLPSNRMVKIAHKKGAIDLKRIERFGEKNIEYLYVSKDDYSSLVTELVRGMKDINKNPHLSEDVKMNKFFNVAETVYTELLRLPISDDSLNRAVQLSEELSGFINDKPDFTKLIRTVVGMGEKFTRHSLGTVVAANLLVTKLDWSSPKLLTPITMGAFFHDIGLKEIPEELRFKQRIDMSKDESMLWETHPAIGINLLHTLPSVTTDVIRIVAEHHEIPNGSGFPNHIRFDRIFPMAKVVSMANQMAHDLFGDAETQFSLEKFIEKLEHVYPIMYGSDLSKAAKKIFKKKDKNLREAA